MLLSFLPSIYYFPCLFVSGTQRVVMLCFYFENNGGAPQTTVLKNKVQSFYLSHLSTPFELGL